MATALLIGTTAWAANYTIGGDGATHANLKAFKTAVDNGTITLSSADIITLGANQALAANSVYDFGGARINTGSFRFNISAASTFTVKNAVISGTSNIFLGNKSNATGSVTLNLENVQATTTGAQVFDLRVFNYNVTFDENCAVSSATQTFYVYDANVSLNVTNNADMDWSVSLKVTNAQDQTFTNNAGNFTFKQCPKQTIYFSGDVTISGSNGATVIVNESADRRFGLPNSLTLNNITVKEGSTIRSAVQGANITVTGGTFVTAPATGATGTIAGECKFPAGPATGGLTIASGYKGVADGHIYAASVTPGPVVKLTHNGSTQTFEYLDDAFSAAQDGDEISLLDDIDQLSTIWIGTKTLNGTAKSLTLDLAGHSITADSRISQNFIISHGSLLVKNSVPGQGGIYNMNSGDVFALYGSYLKNCNPRIQAPFSHLTIEEGVDIFAQQPAANGICIYEIKDDKALPMVCDFVSYLTNIYGPSTGVANGVRVDMKGNVHAGKYGVKVNGNVAYPNASVYTVDATLFPDYQGPIAVGDTAYAPYIYIYSTAHIEAASDQSSATAVYASGYARWIVEGTCSGATGVYIKSGDVNLNDATIESSWSGAATSTVTGGTSGISSGGNAVVVESNSHYSGQQEITINGDTKITTEATGGAALVEVVDAATNTMVEEITINGGTFSGDYAIVISEQSASSTETEITIGGVALIGATEVGTDVGTEAVNRIIDPTTSHITTIDNPDGSTTLVVSSGVAPAPKTEWVDVAALAAGSDAKWTGFTPGVIGDGTTATTVTLGELQIISGNATDGVQQLTIKDKATLKVDKLIMNDFARIIVEAGGKLIVQGEQGINAPVVDNILLKASETAQALFLFNPAVTSNRHPKAKVEYHSNSFYSDHDIQQFFGIPTYNGGVTNIETTSTAEIYFDVWRNPGWDYVGAINVPADPSVLDHLDKFNLPFALCCITSMNDADHKPVFTFSGELTGNIDHTFTLQKGWTSMANAYMGPIDKDAIIAQLAAWNANYGTEQSVYTYDLNAATGAIQWHARNKFSLPKGLNAMQPIMFHNGSKVEGIVLDYSTLVWDPFVAASLAPARRQATSLITKAQINIATENEADYITIVADSELGNDRSFCAPKYNNAGLQLYVTGDEKYDVFAADVIENSYIGYRTVNAGIYTVSFENVSGENLVLVDLINGARTNITEGAIYTFRAEANESNDYRFQIVTPAKTPTSIDNTDADARAKKAGVYTLTGQYLGNASIFSTLPAGVYVVDGVKKVK